MKWPVCLFLVLAGCNCTHRGATPDRWRDAAPRAECTDACGCAEANLRVACPKLVGPDFGDWCQAMLDNHQPICAVKLAGVANCEEADQVCR